MTRVLVVVDMQRDFIDGALGTTEAIEIIPAVVSTINQFDGEIFYTLDTHQEDYLSTAEGRELPIPHCIQGSIGWQLSPEVEAALQQKQAKAVEKPTFGSVTLMHQLSQVADVESITFVGLCTDICVISNALLAKAYFPEKSIYVIANACAGTTPDNHKRALESMKTCQIKIAEV